MEINRSTSSGSTERFLNVRPHLLYHRQVIRRYVSEVDSMFQVHYVGGLAVQDKVLRGESYLTDVQRNIYVRAKIWCIVSFLFRELSALPLGNRTYQWFSQSDVTSFLIWHSPLGMHLPAVRQHVWCSCTCCNPYSSLRYVP